MRELFLEKLQQLGYDKSQYSLHSLRAGGATQAANAGVPDRLFSEDMAGGNLNQQKMVTLKTPRKRFCHVSKSLNL